MKIVFDLESDGFLDSVSKVHVVSYRELGSKKVQSVYSPSDIRGLFEASSVVVGHNIVRYDLPVLKKVLGVTTKAKVYDTLPMSWVMFPKRSEHGLDSFGKDYGIPKPKIDDWENLTIEEYTHRCQEDVKINTALWEDLVKRFRLVYGDERELMDQYFQYLTFKMRCAQMAEEARWKLDIDLVRKSLVELESQQAEKVQELKQVMPKVNKYRDKAKPAQTYKKDGSLTKAAQDWFKLLDDNKLPREYEGTVKVLQKTEEPNPNSSDQVKSWLFSMGWKPCTFDYKTNDKGEERAIPQVRKDGELAPSVVILIDDHPEVGLLDGLTVIQHRKSIFEGMLEGVDSEGYVKAEIAGLTNTLRFKHKKPLVNLPGVDKSWGKEIRGALIAPEGHILCGADMTSLESTTKRHFIYPYDPDYVEEMSVPGFDEHLDLAVKAGYLEPDDYSFYTRSEEDTVNDVERYTTIKKVRKKFKPVNYSAVYGVGKRKLSRTTGMPESEAQSLLDAYWQRNWAVKKFAEDQEVKTVGGQMWIRNPVNKYWYTLRFKKDAFSTLNQGTGAYCFDQWVAYYLTRRPNIVGQFHDESINSVPLGEEKEHESVLKWAIDKVNQKLKLNVDLGIDVQFGYKYSEIH